MTAPGRGFDAPVARLVARRYLVSARREAFVRFLAGAATIGIGLGTAALILALAALAGFQRALKGEILARTPEIEIELPAAADAAAVRREVERLAPAARVARTVRGRGWVLGDGRVRPVEIVGYEGELPATLPGASGRAPGLYVGERLATAWGLAPGAGLEIASNRPALSPFGPQPRVRRLAVAGTFASGRTDEVDVLALPLAEAVALLGEEGLRLQVTTGGLERALDLAPRLAAALPSGSRLRTWQDLNRALLFALRLEKSVTFAAVFLIVLVASLALLSGLLLVLASKRREVGMLGAMGATPQTIRRAFLWLAASLVGAGLAAGGAVGVGAAWLLDRYRVVRLPEQVYFVDHVPFEVEIGDLAVVLAASAAVALGCAALAAARAAALAPVEALRR